MNNKKLCEIAKIKFCSLTPSRAKPTVDPVNWVACTNFLDDNIVDFDNITVSYVLPDDDWLLQSDDIVIKRITPTFVNYIECVKEEIYCGNNLIIVSPDKSVDAKYLAMILNEKIAGLSKESSVGAVMKSVSKADLSKIEISLPDIDIQKKLGFLWYNGIELKKKKSRLAELENIKINQILKKAINMFGGKENG